jgi:hypothetical protein
MPLCTRNVVLGPPADVQEDVYSGMDKIALCFILSHLIDMWGPHVRVVFNLVTQQPLWLVVLA